MNIHPKGGSVAHVFEPMIDKRSPPPLVSILMVARNAAPYINAALQSARIQTLGDIEIVVVDDGSQDGTADIARSHEGEDKRVRIVQGPCSGLSAVRNVSLAEARGRYAAILDADDILHPRHIATLLEQLRAGGAQICAANMIEFSQADGGVAANAFATGPQWGCARSVGLEEFVRCGMIGGGSPSLGYLKPLFDLHFLRRHTIAYDPRLRIGEDFDIVARAMLRGAEYRFAPQPTYFYRRHASSTSHRLTQGDVDGLIAATRDYQASGTGLSMLMALRLRNLEGARRQIAALAALRERRFFAAARTIGLHSQAIGLVAHSLYESCLKRTGLWRGQRRAAGNSMAPTDSIAPTYLQSLTTALTANPLHA